MSGLVFNHEYWMHYALQLAQYAQNNNEVPIGAVLVRNNKIISEGWNSSISNNDPTAHAEIIALRQGGSTLQNYRIVNTILYVTLEPCMMCLGAMIHSRISMLVYGANNKKNKGNLSLINTMQNQKVNHQIEMIGGILAPACSILLTDFFIKRRLQKMNRLPS